MTDILPEFARWLGYPRMRDYFDACEGNPSAVMARLRRRLSKPRLEE